MAKLFIHITSGPELPNKVSLGLLVAAASDKKKHDVKVFFAADGVHLLNCKEKGQIVGLGTGDIKDHLDELKRSQTKIYVSRLSAIAISRCCSASSSSSFFSSSTSSTSSSSFLKTPRRTRPRAWTPRRSSRPSLAGTPPPGAPRPGRTDRSTRGRRRRRSEGRSCMFIGQLKGDAIECRNRAMGETHVCRERTGGTNGAACVRCASDTQSTLLSHGCNFTSFTPPFRQPNR